MSEIVADSIKVSELIKGIAKDVVENQDNISAVAVVGIQTRGVFLAERIRKEIENLTGRNPESGILDITLYRDDINSRRILPLVKETVIPFDVSGTTVYLIDDVLFTGRTIKAALENITSFGRPASIKLAVLVDRGNRELPIQPDITGVKIQTSLNDEVIVKMNEIDGIDEIILKRENNAS